MNVTLYQIAERFIGVTEAPGSATNPQILSMLHLDTSWPEGDETPWCSAFVNYVAWLLNLPRSKSLRARSWLQVGVPVTHAVRGFDVVVLSRGDPWYDQPGPDVTKAPGHVGLFCSDDSRSIPDRVWILGGNQGNSVSLKSFEARRILGVRRLWGAP